MFKQTLVAGGVAAALLLSGCGESAPSASATTGDGSPLTHESYCTVAGLPASLRHTYIFIDQRMLAKAAGADDFVAKNAAVRDAVLGFGDPTRATQAAFDDWRERISLYVMPADGGAARPLFSGCVPALSPSELADVRKGDSAVKTFFAGDAGQAVTDEQRKFRSLFIGALLRAAADAPPAAKGQTEALAETSVVKSLVASGRLINADSGVPRIVVVSNLAGINVGGAKTVDEAKKAGFADGAKSGLDLGRSEVHVLLIDGPNSSLSNAYASAFFLAQNGRLLTWAKSPSLMPLPPQTVTRYAGTVEYVTTNAPIQLRIAVDKNGALTDSWFVLQGETNVAIPLTGTDVCESPEHCHLSDDGGGFAQAWSTKTGSAVNIDEHLPFAGARNWKFNVQADQLSGTVSDPIIKYPSHTELHLTAALAPKATF